MTTPTKSQKLKSWMSNHSEDIIAASIIAGSVAAFVAVVVYTNKQYNVDVAAWNEHADEIVGWINDQTKAGNFIYALSDGTYLTVAADAAQEIVRK
jgi:hypothetical protein